MKLAKNLITRVNTHIKLPDEFLKPIEVAYEKVLADEALVDLCIECRDVICSEVNPHTYGSVGNFPKLAEFDDSFSDLLRAIILISNYDNLLALYREKGIPESQLSEILPDLAVAIGESTRLSGHVGLGGIRFGWMALHFTAQIFRIGRLQYCYLPDYGLLDVHIPRDGKLVGCDESYEMALEFYSKHFPDLPIIGFTCKSWLCDPTLKEILPATSNILTFQSRYTTGKREDVEGYSAVYEYVYDLNEKPEDLNTLPEDTSVRRVIKAFLLKGGNIHNTPGFIRVPLK